MLQLVLNRDYLLSKDYQAYQMKKIYVEFISCVATKTHLYECLDIPKLSYNLSEVISDNTVIILDQMESPVIGELKSMLREVAPDSRKTKNYVVIVSVSNKDVAEKILSLNGDGKISSLGSASDFLSLVSDYVEKSRSYKSWSDKDRTDLVELATIADAPGFLFNLESQINPSPVSILQNNKILASTKSYAASWAVSEESTLDEHS
jgi:hypothetical protein